MLHAAQNNKNRFWLTLAIFAVIIFVVFSPTFSGLISAQGGPPPIPPPPPPPTETYFCLPSGAPQCTSLSYNSIDACRTVCEQSLVGGQCLTLAQCNANGATPQVQREAEGSQVVSWAATKVLQGIVDVIKLFNHGLKYVINLSAFVLRVAIDVSLAPLHNIKAIDIGWGLTRDVTNIFFIFALLIIAIATILRLESYNAKKLLVNLIVMALLVNFSLVVARTVVDASNLLGLTFIRTIYPVDEKLASILNINRLDSTEEPPPAPQPPYNYTVSANTIAAVQKGNVAWYAVGQSPLKSITASPNPFDPIVGEFFIQLIMFVFQILAFFIFLMLAVMYIIRTVALILIFILAPFGFVFMVLPGTRGYASRWWSALFSWSFFFPISAFLLYIAVQWGIQMSQFNEPGSIILNSGLTFQYIAVTIFLLASILIAKQMSLFGAGTIIGLGTALRKKTVDRMGKAGWQGTKNATVRYSAPLAGTLANNGVISKIPFATRGLQAIGAQERSNIDEYKKSIDKYSSKELRARSVKIGTNRTAQAAILDKLAERGDIEYDGKFTQAHARQGIQFMKQLGKNPKNVYRLDPTLVDRKNNQSITDALREQKITITSEDIKKMDNSVKENPEVVGAIIRTTRPNTAQVIMEEGTPEMVSQYRDQLHALAKTKGDENGSEELIEALKKEGNEPLGSKIVSTPSLRRALGFSEPKQASKGSTGGGSNTSPGPTGGTPSGTPSGGSTGNNPPSTGTTSGPTSSSGGTNTPTPPSSGAAGTGQAWTSSPGGIVTRQNFGGGPRTP